MGDKYKDPKNRFTDDGEFLVYDKDFSNSVGFLTFKNGGFGVSKFYLVEILRRKLTQKFRDEYWTKNDGNANKLLNKYAKKLDKLIRNQLKWFLLLNTSDDSFYSTTPIYRDIEVDFIYFVLKSELYKEWDRIDCIIDAAAEKYDESLSKYGDEEKADAWYWEWIIHAIEYPDETDDEWKQRILREKENEQQFLEHLKMFAKEHTEDNNE